MSNPIYSSLGVVQSPAKRSIVDQFKEFRQSFTGDPQAKLNELLSSGKVTKEQIDSATMLAEMMKGLVSKK